jgi:hypothetical protein
MVLRQGSSLEQQSAVRIEQKHREGAMKMSRVLVSGDLFQYPGLRALVVD